MKDKQIPEEELFVELDSMYQRVADIEKEEAAETPIPEKKKPRQKKKRSYRYFVIVASISFIILASIFTVTILKPTIIPQLFKMGDTQLLLLLPLWNLQHPLLWAPLQQPHPPLLSLPLRNPPNPLLNRFRFRQSRRPQKPYKKR
jgi:hypothetical protein